MEFKGKFDNSLEKKNKMTEQEIAPYKKMPHADKLRLIASMHMQARAWKRAAFKAQHPDWSAKQIDKRVREVFLYGTG